MYKKGIGSIFPNLAKLAASRQSELRSYGALRHWPEPRKELSFFGKGRVCQKPTGLEIGTTAPQSAASGAASGAAMAGP